MFSEIISSKVIEEAINIVSSTMGPEQLLEPHSDKKNDEQAKKANPEDKYPIIPGKPDARWVSKFGSNKTGKPYAIASMERFTENIEDLEGIRPDEEPGIVLAPSIENSQKESVGRFTAMLEERKAAAFHSKHHNLH